MTVREAFELIDRLKTIKNCLQAKHGDKEVINNLQLYRKIRKYNQEIENITEAIMNMEFDDSYTFDYHLYILKEEEK